MSADKTPTESMIGFDAEGIPPKHTAPAARQHTDQHDSTTRIILPGKDLPPHPVRDVRSSGRVQAALESTGYREPILRRADDLAYMAPERVEQMLARCNHICRVQGCGQVVDRCGQNCDECQEGIDAMTHINEDITHKARNTFLSALYLIIPLVLLLFVAVAAVKGLWQ